MSSYGTTTSIDTSATHGDNHTSPWAKVRDVLLCSSGEPFEGDEKERENLLQHPIKRGGKFMGIEVEWAEEKPKQRTHK